MGRKLKVLFLILALVFLGYGNALAGSNTSNLNIYKPTIGEVDWGASVNTGFDIIDTALGTQHTSAGIHIGFTIGVGSVPSGVEAYIAGDVGITGDLTIGDDLDLTGDLTVGGNEIFMAAMKTGVDQAASGAIAGELYADSNDDYTIKLGQ